jgi:type IV secretory pathway VirB2 component (pilin)
VAQQPKELLEIVAVLAVAVLGHLVEDLQVPLELQIQVVVLVVVALQAHQAALV